MTQGRGRRARHAALLGATALVAAAALAPGGAGARPSSASICRSTYEADYAVAAVHLTVTRTGHFTAQQNGETVDATQTDVIAPAKDARDHVRLQVETVCRQGEIRFIDEARRGSSQVSGSWTQTNGSPSQGTCSSHRNWPLNREQPAFRLWIKRPNRGGYNAFFTPGARSVGLQMTLSPPDGQVCDTPIPANFSYPQIAGNRLATPPVTVSLRTLQRDRPFTLPLNGSAGPRQADWTEALAHGYDGSATFGVSWTGSISFRPAGCRHYVFTTHSVRVLHNCH